MSTIPLAALHLNPPPQQPDPMEQYGRLLQIKNQMANAPLQRQALEQQVQQGAQSLQQGQNQLDQQKEAEKSQKALMQGYTEAGGDLTKAIPLAAKYGAAPDALIKLQSAATQQQTANLALFKAKGERSVQEADLMASAHDVVDKAPVDQKPALYQQQLQALGQAGVDISSAPPQYPGDEAFKVFGIGIQGHKAQLEELAKQATQQEAARHNLATEANTAATTAGTNAYRQAELAQGSKRISIEGARLKFEQQKEATMSGGSAGPGLIDQIGTGKIALDRLGYLVAKNPALLEAVSQKYPDFDSSKAGAYVSAYKDFTSTKPNTAGGSLLAGGVALKHLNELKDLNTPASHIPHTPAWTAYQNKADTVSGELGRFYQTDTIPQVAAIKSTLASTLPGNRDAAITTQAQSMGDRLNSYQQAWENAAPSKAYQAPMPGLDAEAMAARSKLDPRYKGAQSSGGISVTAPNGKAYSFKDQASADAFKQKAGIQ